MTETATAPAVLDPDWHLQAACAGANTDLFFAGRGTKLANRVVEFYCQPCPVRAECLADELRITPYDRRGIRGGVHFGRGGAA